MSTTMIHSLHIETLLLRKATVAIKAINHKLRIRMLEQMHQSGHLTVSALYQHMHLPQPVVSQHLAVLRQAGFVHTERKGRHIHYSVNYEWLKEVESLCRALTYKRTTAADILEEPCLL